MVTLTSAGGEEFCALAADAFIIQLGKDLASGAEDARAFDPEGEALRRKASRSLSALLKP